MSLNLEYVYSMKRGNIDLRWKKWRYGQSNCFADFLPSGHATLRKCVCECPEATAHVLPIDRWEIRIPHAGATNELLLGHMKQMQAGLAKLGANLADLRSDMITVKMSMATVKTDIIATPGTGMAALTGREDRMDLRL